MHARPDPSAAPARDHSTRTRPASAAALDKAHSWHPFTQMKMWCADGHDPLVIADGNGAVLRDIGGREYLDGNSSIWTNLHGHGHPAITRAIKDQLDRVAHVSYLGTTHEPACELAAALAALFDGELPRVFFSDDGSTAVEVALKMAAQYWRMQGEPARERFLAFDRAYHGDTAGAASLGGIGAFGGPFSGSPFPVDRVASADDLPADGSRYAAAVIEPVVQGAAGIRLWPPGTLRALRDWCDAHGVLLVLDEVLTGFGRTGKLFGCWHEAVTPDFIALAKGLTGGYLPLAATLTTSRVFDAFLGEPEEQKTLYYGHSYTANPLGCAAALANLRIFRDENVLASLATKIDVLRGELARLAAHPNVREIRQAGFIAGIEIARPDGTPYPWFELRGARACTAAREFGLLTRPILDTLVLMPPFCITADQIRHAVDALGAGIDRACRHAT